MEKVKKVGKDKFVGLAQTMRGYNVSTYSLGKGNNLKQFVSKNTRTLKVYSFIYKYIKSLYIS